MAQYVALALAQRGGDWPDVVPAVAVFGELQRFATGFEVTQPHRHGEDLGLSARVVDVVFAG
ncbi:MAG: hypothetical protein ACK56I_16825, partial [bacterium]